MFRSPVPMCVFLTAVLGVSPVLTAEIHAADRPNLIVFFTDDLGYGDLSCYGARQNKTPNLDRMAAEGTRFTAFYVQPVCGVSRAALMTGCYPIRVAEVGNTKSGHPVLHTDEITMAEVLKSQGYTTGLVGKWHLAGGRKEVYDETIMPTGQGFDTFFGTPLHNGFTREVDSKSFKTQIMRGMEILDDFLDQEEMNQLTRRYTEEAVRFIRENRDGPFFLYLAHNMPHVPIGASDEFRGTSQGGSYGDTIEELDWSMGQVLQALKEAEIDEETLVVFTSDNGPWIEAHLAADDGSDPYYGSAGPLRGYKMTTWEGGLRVPCIARWPGRVPAGRVCDEMLTSMDLLPTFAHLAEATLPKDRTLDGHNVWPVMAGEPGVENPRQTLYYYCFNHLQAVRHGRWKLVLPRRAKPPWCSWSARMVDAVPELALFDVEADVGETTNVADRHADVVAELSELIEEARRDLGDFNRVGEGARFFDAEPRRPDVTKWEGVDSMGRPKPADGGGPYPRNFRYSTAIPPEEGVTRRDPSDVLHVGDTYFVWYSKVTAGPDVWGYPSGYSADVWYATSANGKAWTEQGLSIGKGGAGAWDEHGVFTPNILAAEGKYYLFYTGVPKPFDENTKTAIGVAVAESPDGPWTKVETNPVLRPSDNAEDFDSMRVDDAALIVRDGAYWFYYKGRQLDHTPGETKMGVAIAQDPLGPYEKHSAGPLHPGHEVLVWPHGEGVASMATAAGPRQIYFATDGIQFSPRNEIANPPQAPGGFRSDSFEDDKPGKGLSWGISHARQGKDLYLLRFDAQMAGSVSKAGQARYRPEPFQNGARPFGCRCLRSLRYERYPDFLSNRREIMMGRSPRVYRTTLTIAFTLGAMVTAHVFAAEDESRPAPLLVTAATKADPQARANLEQKGTIFFRDDFESPESLKKYFEIRGLKQGDAKLVTDTKLAHSGNGAIQFTASSRDGRESGVGASGWLGPKGHDRVYFRRYIKFASDYDQGNLNHVGGGLAGVAGANRYGGMGGAGIRPRGDDRFTSSFEPWRDWGRYPAPGYMFLYTYWMDMKQDRDGNYWGNMLGPDKADRISLERDRWVCLEHMIQANDVGQANGELAAWIDGKLYLHYQGLRWRSDASVKLKRFNFGLYVHRATQDNTVWYDDVVLSSGYVGPEPE